MALQKNLRAIITEILNNKLFLYLFTGNETVIRVS